MAWHSNGLPKRIARPLREREPPRRMASAGADRAGEEDAFEDTEAVRGAPEAKKRG